MEILVGRLTSDAKVHEMGDDKKVVNFSIAINERYRRRGNGEIQKTVKYVDCAYWVNPGIAEYLKKGGLVELSGSISARAWKTLDGEPKAALRFHVSGIKLHSASKKEEAVNEKTVVKTTEVDLPF